MRSSLWVNDWYSVHVTSCVCYYSNRAWSLSCMYTVRSLCTYHMYMQIFSSVKNFVLIKLWFHNIQRVKVMRSYIQQSIQYLHIYMRLICAQGSYQWSVQWHELVSQIVCKRFESLNQPTFSIKPPIINCVSCSNQSQPEQNFLVW